MPNLSSFLKEFKSRINGLDFTVAELWLLLKKIKTL